MWGQSAITTCLRDCVLVSFPSCHVLLFWCYQRPQVAAARYLALCRALAAGVIEWLAGNPRNREMVSVRRRVSRRGQGLVGTSQDGKRPHRGHYLVCRPESARTSAPSSTQPSGSWDLQAFCPATAAVTAHGRVSLRLCSHHEKGYRDAVSRVHAWE